MASLAKIIGAGGLIGCLVLGFIFQEAILQQFGAFLGWVEVYPMIGAVLYVILYSITAVFCIPAVILTLGSGYIFTTIYDGYIGYLVACIVDFTGATCGALLAFLVCKLLFFSWVNSWAKQYQQFEIAQILMKKDGVKVMMLLRVLMPYNPLNYLLGITNVTTYEYLVSCVGMIPSTMGWCFVGSTLSALSEINQMSDRGVAGLYEDNPKVIVIGIAFVSVLVSAIWWISNRAKSEFTLMMLEMNANKMK